MDRGLLAGDLRQEHIHFVGIGGIGLSAIARILIARGARVSGSDSRLSPVTDGLAALGATIFEGHHPNHIQGATLLVVSSAIPSDNVEVVAARERNIPVLKRADILGEMMRDRGGSKASVGIAIAGTHGKTTTTAMIAHLLIEAGHDPTVIVGGVMTNLGANARTGKGPYFVIEADEYDHMFLGLRPHIAVVTHLEMDHPDCFPTLEAMEFAFHRFLSLVPDEGQIVACTDEPNVRSLVAEFRSRATPVVITYGFSSDASWQAAGFQTNAGGGSDFEVLRGGSVMGRFRLTIPGKHNVKNALAALAVADLIGLELDVARKALATFKGVKRRFELKGEANGITVIDDYAHHPTEIQASLAAARARYPMRPIWAVFQPHTYSRTKALLESFAVSFGEADHVIVTEIYAAREQNALGTHAIHLVQAMAHRDVHYCATLDEAVTYLLEQIKPGDVVITLGAGDGFTIGERVLHELQTGN